MKINKISMEDGRKKYKELFDKENIPTKLI